MVWNYVSAKRYLVYGILVGSYLKESKGCMLIAFLRIKNTHTWQIRAIYNWTPFVSLAKSSLYRHLFHPVFDNRIHVPDLQLLNLRSTHLLAVKLSILQHADVSCSPVRCISSFLCKLFRTNPLRLALKCDNAPFSKQNCDSILFP